MPWPFLKRQAREKGSMGDKRDPRVKHAAQVAVGVAAYLLLPEWLLWMGLHGPLRRLRGVSCSETFNMLYLGRPAGVVLAVWGSLMLLITIIDERKAAERRSYDRGFEDGRKAQDKKLEEDIRTVVNRDVRPTRQAE